MKAAVSELALVAFLMNVLPSRSTNIILANIKDGLTWNYAYSALRK